MSLIFGRFRCRLYGFPNPKRMLSIAMPVASSSIVLRLSIPSLR